MGHYYATRRHKSVRSFAEHFTERTLRGTHQDRLELSKNDFAPRAPDSIGSSRALENTQDRATTGKFSNFDKKYAIRNYNYKPTTNTGKHEKNAYCNYIRPNIFKHCLFCFSPSIKKASHTGHVTEKCNKHNVNNTEKTPTHPDITDSQISPLAFHIKKASLQNHPPHSCKKQIFNFSLKRPLRHTTVTRHHPFTYQQYHHARRSLLYTGFDQTLSERFRTEPCIARSGQLTRAEGYPRAGLSALSSLHRSGTCVPPCLPRCALHVPA